MRVRYDMPWRAAYELYAALAWSAAGVSMALAALVSGLPSAPFWTMGACAAGLAAWTWRQALGLLDLKLSLAGRAFSFIAPASVFERMRRHPGTVWLGYGFEWTPRHTQRMVELRKREMRDLMPPRWFLRLRGVPPQDRNAVGAPWIHGVEPSERDVHIPLSALEGNTVIFGTTGAGKTSAFEVMIFQAVARGDVVIVIDPKGDRELREVTRRACQCARRPEAFLMFHPAFPGESIRLDPLKNWSRVTSVASRIAALLPAEGGGDAFVNFAWRAMNVVAAGLVYVEERPNLVKLRRFVESGAGALLQRVLETYYTRTLARWPAQLAPHIERARAGRSAQRLGVGATAELAAYIDYYTKEVPAHARREEIDGLLSMVLHDQTHYAKMIQNVLPLLSSLTSGDLGPLLSPDAADIADRRPVFDSDKIIKGAHVLYVGLDSLSDPTVGSAIGSILIADLAAVAGDIYNYGRKQSIELFVDEVAECVNTPLIQVLNKGRGSGFRITLAAQTLPDIVAKLGDESKARMVIGNCNNLIALRTKDRLTQDFVVETFGETHIQTLMRTQATAATSRDVHLSGNLSERLSEERVDVFAPEWLGMLPSLHYIAMVSGGRLIKGRLPKIADEPRR